MRYFLLLIVFALSLPLQAASPVWLVESGHNKLYLAGTVHLLRASDYPLPDALKRAYVESQTLAFETNIDQTSDARYVQQVMQAVTLPQGTTLKDKLSTQTLSQLEDYLLKNQLQLNHFNAFKPSMVAMSLSLLELKKLGAGAYGVDRFYFNMAKTDGKKTLALESVQQQLQFLSDMGEGLEDLMIQQTLEDIKTLPSQFNAMIASWRQGDIDRIEQLFVEPMREQFNAIYQQLLVERNLDWLPQLIKYLDSAETEMVLVGIAHLIGKDGLLNLLKLAGYRITQLD